MVRRSIHTEKYQVVFKVGKTNLMNQTRPGRLITETNKASIGLVQSFTDKNPRVSHSYLIELS